MFCIVMGTTCEAFTAPGGGVSVLEDTQVVRASVDTSPRDTSSTREPVFSYNSELRLFLPPAVTFWWRLKIVDPAGPVP